MDFNIHTTFAEYSDEQEGAVQEFLEQVLDRFVASPEFRALEDSWRHMHIYLDYAWSYLGQMVSQITPEDQDEILFELFPRKVSTQPETGPKIIAEVRAFWQWLDREYQLPNARRCLQALDAGAGQRLQAELSNPRNFGMAKSFVMQGMKAGYDMTTQEGSQAFMLRYNAQRLLDANRAALPVGASGWLGSPLTGGEKKDLRKKRKLQRQNRRRNRR